MLRLHSHPIWWKDNSKELYFPEAANLKHAIQLTATMFDE